MVVDKYRPNLPKISKSLENASQLIEYRHLEQIADWYFYAKVLFVWVIMPSHLFRYAPRGQMGHL